MTENIEAHGFKKWEPLMVLSLALFIIVLDATLLNVSLSVLIRDLNTTIQNIQWVITAYALVLAAFTITGGRIGDLIGRKKTFMIGAGIFAVGSFIASISTNVGMMIAGEAIIEGFGAALMMPATASLLISTYRGRDRAMAFGIWGGVAAAASAVGPLLGGWLTSNYSWRWGFRINVVVAAILILGSVLIKESYDDKEKKQFDLMGVLLSSLGLLSIVFGVIEASTYGWWSAKRVMSIGSIPLDFGSLSITPVAIVVGLILLACFAIWEIAHEKEGKTPLVSMKMFKNRQFTSGAITTGVITLAQAGMVFILPVFLQSVLGLDAFHTGVALLPISVTVLIAAPIAATLSRKYPAKYIIQVGMIINFIALWVIRAALSPDMHSNALIPGLALYGIGMGAVMGPINNITLSAVPVWQAGEASGVNNTMRQVGQSLGAAVIGAVLLTQIVSGLQTNVNSSPVLPAPVKAAVIQNITNPDTDVEFGLAKELPAGTPVEIQNEMSRITKESTTKANKNALAYAAIFSALGLLVSFGLPSIRDLEQGHKQEDPALKIAVH